MTIKIEIDGVETKSALIKEILEQDTLEKVAYKIAELQSDIAFLGEEIDRARVSPCKFGDVYEDEYTDENLVKRKKHLQQIKKWIFGKWSCSEL